MNDPELIPCLPESAPFTPEQRAYLNGFLAGLFSRAPAGAAAPCLEPVTILFGSQTGNAENLARRMAKEASKRGFAPTVHDLRNYPLIQLGSEGSVLIVTSTYGDGEPPDNAKGFWELLSAKTGPDLSRIRYSICALGDSNYPKFCGFGKELDRRLEELGARRIQARQDCDLDFEEPFLQWIDLALKSLGTKKTIAVEVAAPASIQEFGSPPKHSRADPFHAPLLVNRALNASGSAKETRHFEISLENSGLSYQTGDALGVFPTNCPSLVTEILSALNVSGDESVPGRDKADVSLRDALFGHYEITRISPAFLQAMAERTGEAQLQSLVQPGVNGELTRFLWGREIIDLLLAHPGVRFQPREFVALLKKLQPRLYSISSSPRAHPGAVHLTVSVVRYASLARNRKGVCSTFLADRAGPAGTVPVFVQGNPNFRLPQSGDAPVIMVGPGTGIAPFRAFLEERRCTGARGRNWLYFGDQRASTDFLYRDELESMRREGLLTRLDTAFSRDQPEKIYVQDRMREGARELFAWLEEGAHFYVCGDANRMAKDVDTALQEIIRSEGGLTAEESAAYIAKLRTEKRYQRDVY